MKHIYRKEKQDIILYIFSFYYIYIFPLSHSVLAFIMEYKKKHSKQQKFSRP